MRAERNVALERKTMQFSHCNIREGRDGERGRRKRWKINIKIPADFVAAPLK
jgi:hypothetical protein